MNEQDRDLTGRSGLVFGIKGDGVYRIWVQVRDRNPASADDGLEYWFASVRTSTEWRRVAVPFARLRSINKKTDGRLDLDKVRQLVFVIDRGAEKPGSEGRIWIDDVGAVLDLLIGWECRGLPRPACTYYRPLRMLAQILSERRIP